ncbi:putative serine protease PepD [Microbacteriaceae bacterium SG_E_30_P1]|uniref:Serine protease PepD n=1 Tax=Antiquaquibacter oligotrophicus TaxID=2880260 RepID=A0ABT6KKA6_9MICO|nr:trypsin-like peptidase domain-containing protein [Antiquaquibacter oligotrophicus]MDH6180442.1 putative serine protease PepD [Antiquaquibacter oligotrophicus]UDF13820.1 trypsin-like peptidase domain-containing protein [Antiquaquibacter oligotrophicus]
MPESPETPDAPRNDGAGNDAGESTPTAHTPAEPVESAPAEQTASSENSAIALPAAPSAPSTPAAEAAPSAAVAVQPPAAEAAVAPVAPAAAAEPVAPVTHSAPQAPAAPTPPASHTAPTFQYPAPSAQTAPPGVPPTTPPVAGAPIDPAQHPALARPQRRGITVGVVAAIAAAALVGGVSGAGVALWAVGLQGNEPGTVAGPATITVNDADDANLITAVAAQAAPSVVTISVSSETAAGSGSGVVIDSDGYILTNAHVVTLDGATANPVVEVQTNDGRILDATVVGVDPIYDLAVIKVETDDPLPAITFADSSDLNVGDTAIAIGAPLGLAGTVTNGIVSALNRSITVASSAVPEEQAPDEQMPEDPGQDPFDFWNFDLGPDQQLPQQQAPSSSSTISLSVIQTDAAINPGNSGGALLNSDGELIGINVAIATASGGEAAGSIGVGFSIPSNVAKRVSQELIENGSATHGLLGASVADVGDDEAQVDAGIAGASIVEIVPGGAAEAAGLKVGDIVTAINGLPVTNRNDLTAQVRALAGGSEATISFVRNGKSDTVDVTLGSL